MYKRNVLGVALIESLETTVRVLKDHNAVLEKRDEIMVSEIRLLEKELSNTADLLHDLYTQIEKLEKVKDDV